MRKNKQEINEQIRLAKSIHEDLLEIESYDVSGALNKVNKRIDKTLNKQRFLHIIRRAAAVILIPILLGTSTLSYLYIKKTYSPEITYYTVTSASGTITQVELPDKSKVWLNSMSTLKYPAEFKHNKRIVSLTGEGFFEVETNPSNPFYVEIDGGKKIKAHGTSFNVSAYSDDSFSEIILAEGIIDVIINEQVIPIKPNEMAHYDKKKKQMTISTVNTSERLAWKEGQLIFRNAPIEEVARKLSRQFNVDIIVEKRSNIDYKFRASFSNETLNQIMTYLQQAAPIEWSFQKGVQQSDLTYSRQQLLLTIK